MSSSFCSCTLQFLDPEICFVHFVTSRLWWLPGLIMFVMVHVCFSLTATQGEIIKINPAYKLFSMGLFCCSQPYTLRWRQSLLPCTGLLGEKRNDSVWKDREKVRIFTLRSVARSLCSAQRSLKVRECSLAVWVSLGLITGLRPWAFPFGSGTQLFRAAPAAAQWHWSPELEMDKCTGVSHKVWDTEGLMSMDS